MSVDSVKISPQGIHQTPAVLVNASHVTALAVLRSLGRQGIPVICLFERAQRADRFSQITKCSKYITRRYYFDRDTAGDNLVNALLTVGRELGVKAVLIPLHDEEMFLISSRRSVLEEHFHLLLPPHDMIGTLLQKGRFAECAMQNQLPIPRTVFPSDEADLHVLRNSFHFPCIIKPPWRDSAWLQAYGSKKVLVLQTFEELLQAYQELSPRFRGIIIQELLTGPETNILCSFTFLDKNSEPLGMFVCRKIRQFPPSFGNTAMAESIIHPEIAALTEAICRKLKLVGYISIEFKKDPQDGFYKILEVTPARVNRQVGITEVAGVSIPFLWYRHLSGQTLRVNSYSTGCKWVSEANDIRGLMHYLRAGDYTMKTWLASYRNVRGWEVFARDDLKPLLALLPATIRYFLSKAFS